MVNDELTVEAERLRAAIGRVVRAARAADTMPANQAAVLGHLVRDGAMSIAQLARVETVKHQSMTRTVDLLEQQGLVTQQPDPRSARQVSVIATPSGRQRLSQERQARAEALAAALTHAGMTPANTELRRATRFLERLAEAFETSAAMDG